tara:strand:- start:22 stop:390 length:369 start_codon:yes stop_codon:yes gene_type:complete
MRKVDLNRKVYNKDKFNKSIDTEFNEIIPPSDDIEVPLLDVGTFFQNYADIFYDIPKTGDVNSHEFLIKQSTDYVGGDAINADILALLQEINSLRQELFELEEQRLRELAENAEEAVGLDNT